ncbi:hypothetical protein SESBI_45253 [Sesbania bispinosa]|nr:hypothetical protein SESBI_45253 [Sesbania bispinosa]
MDRKRPRKDSAGPSNPPGNSKPTNKVVAPSPSPSMCSLPALNDPPIVDAPQRALLKRTVHAWMCVSGMGPNGPKSLQTQNWWILMNHSTQWRHFKIMMRLVPKMGDRVKGLVAIGVPPLSSSYDELFQRFIHLGLECTRSS